MSGQSKAATGAGKLVDMIAVEPVKHGGKRVEPGGDLIGVSASVAEGLLISGAATLGPDKAKAEAEAKAKAEAEAKAKAEAEAKAKADAEADAKKDAKP